MTSATPLRDRAHGSPQDFGDLEVLEGIDLVIQEHPVRLIGASGSGKSTLLRCIDR